ncbi:(R)-mandelonitrile lyase [Bacillus safensis]|uniref:(R)-mandelonitrile lyase n=1 Tax=Bacillus safensis TaxID=561879 RepID=UPI00046967DB|nr:carboxymuconolactone decarboxylase family protein [Bacillus safensis]
MKNKVVGLTAVSLLAISTSISEKASASSDSSEEHANHNHHHQEQTITSIEDIDSFTGPAETFTGNVTVQPLFNANEHAAIGGAYVTFEPGARSAWHTHPTGQRLVVTDGTGWIQELGGNVEEITEGDIVWCPPGVMHWHGATPDTSMTHMALTGEVDGENVEWGEHVTDEEYTQDHNEADLANEFLEEITLISAYTAIGNVEQLEPALHEALDAGLTINETREVLVHLYAYAGFPRSLNAIELLMNVVEERKENGIKDEVGEDASPIDDERSSIERGTEVQTFLLGQPAEGPLFDFAPVMNDYLKGHLFGDIFSRDVLDYKTRELATISALASMEGVDSQLTSHYNMGSNSGLRKNQINEIIDTLDSVDKKRADNARSLFEEFLNN